MTDSSDLTPTKRQERNQRDKRLARALRENLHRRKEQARARRQQAPARSKDRRNDDSPA